MRGPPGWGSPGEGTAAAALQIVIRHRARLRRRHVFMSFQVDNVHSTGPLGYKMRVLYRMRTKSHASA